MAVLELQEAHGDAPLVGRGAQLRPFGGIGSAFAHLGNHGIGEELHGFSVFVFAQEFRPVDGRHHQRLHFLGNPVGFFDVCANRHVDVDIDILRFVLREELHFWREYPQQHERGEQKPNHAVEEQPWFGAAKGKAQQALIAVFEGREERVLEPSCCGSQEVPIEQANDAAQDKQVAEGVPSCAQEQEAQNDEDSRGDEQTAHVHLRLFHAHVNAGEHGVDHQSNEERRGQHDDQGHRQVFHELPNDARPNGQWEEGRKRGRGRRDNGPSHLANAISRRIKRRHSFIHQSIDVFDHHNAIVYQHAERQNQGEKHHYVEGDAQGAQDGEAQEHGQGDGDPHKQGVAQSEEEEQYPHYEEHAEDNAVLELVHLCPGLVGLVRRNAHVEVGRQKLSLGFFNDAVDFIGGDDEVFTGPFSNVERHHRIAPFPGKAGGLLIDKAHVGHVAQVDGFPTFGFHNDGFQVLGVAEVAYDLHGASAPVHEDVTSRNGQVLLADGLGNVVEAHEHGLGPQVIDLNLHLFGVDAADFGLVDLLNVLDALLKYFCVVLELVDGVVAGQVHLHDRNQLREVEVKNVGVAGQVVGETGVAHGDVHLVFDLSQGDLWGHGEVELDVDGAVPLLARGNDLVDARNAFEFFLNGPGYELFDVARAVAGIGGTHKDLGNDDFWEALLGYGDVGRNAGDQNDRNQDRDSCAVFDRSCTQAKFLGCLGIHGVGSLGCRLKNGGISA